VNQLPVQTPDQRQATNIAVWLCLGIGIGMALGAGIGVALGNIPMGIAIGIALGAGIGGIGIALGDERRRQS
jgi:hypothetical protein